MDYKITCMSRYRFWRKLLGGTWYQHEYTERAVDLTFVPGKRWWSRSSAESSYNKLIIVESYG